MTMRGLAAILAADIVGYSRLMGADVDRTLSRLQVLRGEVIDPAVAKSGGRIVKSTGDGILAEFPSAVEAVRCALYADQDAQAREGTPAGATDRVPHRYQRRRRDRVCRPRHPWPWRERRGTAGSCWPRLAASWCRTPCMRPRRVALLVFSRTSGSARSRTSRSPGTAMLRVWASPSRGIDAPCGTSGVGDGSPLLTSA
jgi:hypothetical protein